MKCHEKLVSSTGTSGRNLIKIYMTLYKQTLSHVSGCEIYNSTCYGNHGNVVKI